jgi:opine dehydrogenase
MRDVAICGGGHLGHTLAAVIGATGEFRVGVLTRRPDSWRARIRLTFGNLELEGDVDHVSRDPAEIVSGAEIVLLTVPAHVRRELLAVIAPHVASNTWVGAVPGAGGFDDDARAALPLHEKVFGTARTPYICRMAVHGAAVDVTGVSPDVRVATLHGDDAPEAASLLEELLTIPAMALGTYDAVNLTPSNPLVHSCRLFSMFEQWIPGMGLASPPSFYGDWDDAASALLLACDDELTHVRAARGIPEHDVPPVRVHYGAETPARLTERIRGLAPLRRIGMPMRENGAGWVPDVGHRYFAEDVGVALPVMQRLSRAARVETPSLDAVVAWGQRQLTAR